jgi:hypothetical protein
LGQGADNAAEALRNSPELHDRVLAALNEDAV